MQFDPARLRLGEVIVGAGGLVLLASMFLLDWYATTARLAPTLATLGHVTVWTGWQCLTGIRWLMLLAGVAALALFYFQAARRAPALPVSLSVITTTLGVLTCASLIYRVLINPPAFGGPLDQKPGAYVGLLAALLITYGGYRSMREEGIAEADGPGEVPVADLPETTHS